MTSVAVIGAGEVGAAVAQALATRDRVSRVLLVDDAANVAAGKALDIQQSGAVTGSHVRLEGTADLTRVMGASACVIADRHGPPAAEWAGDEGLALIRRLLPCAGDAPLVFAGPSQAALMQTAAREQHVSRVRLLGTSTEAFAAAIRSMIALEAGCSPTEVVLAVLGVPPKGLVVPWSEAAIGGFSLERVLTPVQMTRLESRITRLWPPGPYALGTCRGRGRRSRDHRVAAEAQRAHGPRRRVRRPQPGRCPAGPPRRPGGRPRLRPVADDARARPPRHRARLGPTCPPAYLPTCPTCPTCLPARIRGMRSLVAAAVLALAGAAAAAPGDIPTASLLDHIKFLSSDELQGRGAGTPELERAADYVAQQFRAIGLQPGGDGDSWFQPLRARGRDHGRRAKRALVQLRQQDRALHARHELLPARGARQRVDGHSLHDPRRRSARLRRLRAGGAVDRLRRLPSRGRVGQGRRRLQPRAAGTAVEQRHERRAAGDGVHARRQGRRRALARCQSADRHRRPVPPGRPGRLHAVLEGPRRRRPADPGAARAPPRSAAARRPVSARRPRPPDRRRPRAAIDGAERRHDDLHRAPDEEPPDRAQCGRRAAWQRPAAWRKKPSSSARTTTTWARAATCRCRRSARARCTTVPTTTPRARRP